ncbi:MAG TPA: SMP-30/gluconolactonase/LRE family protein [Candidatus Binataceae bacterium]
MMQFELIATGFGGVEGPRVDHHNRLYFSDVIDGGVLRRNPDGSIETLIPGRQPVGGIAFNIGNNLLVTGPSVALWNQDTRQLRDVFKGLPGRRSDNFNDLTIDENGSVWIGTVNGHSVGPLDAPRPPGDLYRLDPDGIATLVWEGVGTSNGLGFSPDGKLLYHCDTQPGHVMVYDVTADRQLRNRRLFAKVAGAMTDGMTVDAEGGVWVAALLAGEVQRFRSDGTLDRAYSIPQKKVLSVVFGGPGLQDLYVVTALSRRMRGSIYRARCDIPGLPLPMARLGAAG